MEDKLYDTRESLARLEEQVSSLSKDNTKEHQEIKEMFKTICCRLDVVERANINREISWKTLTKIGATGLTLFSLAVTVLKLVLGI